MITGTLPKPLIHGLNELLGKDENGYHVKATKLNDGLIVVNWKILRYDENGICHVRYETMPEYFRQFLCWIERTNETISKPKFTKRSRIDAAFNMLPEKETDYFDKDAILSYPNSSHFKHIKISTETRRGAWASVIPQRIQGGDLVAFKHIETSSVISSDENKVKRYNYLKQERALLQELDHPNIVKLAKTKIVFGEGTVGLALFPWCEHRLEYFIQKGPDTPAILKEIALKWMLQLCDAVSYLHSKNVNII